MNPEEETATEGTLSSYPIDDQTMEQIENNFTYHAPKGDQTGRYQEIREAAKMLRIDISRFTPKSREQSLAITKLEEVVFWANAAIARNE